MCGQVSLSSFQRTPQLGVSLLLPTPSLLEDQILLCYSGWRGLNLAGARTLLSGQALGSLLGWSVAVEERVMSLFPNQQPRVLWRESAIKGQLAAVWKEEMVAHFIPVTSTGLQGFDWPAPSQLSTPKQETQGSLVSSTQQHTPMNPGKPWPLYILRPFASGNLTLGVRQQS